MKHLARLALALALLLPLGFGSAQRALEDLKIAFLYVGPVGDYGFSYAHDLGRQALVERFPGLETTFVESVPEAEVEPFVDQLIADGHDVVIGTSFGFGDGLLAAAERYPDVIFGHATGIERAPNVFTFMADFWQVYYLNGLVAGALSETGTIGYVAAFPIPEVKRHINAFAIGAREVNPDAVVDVRWLYAWFDPAGAQEATQALMSEGADVFAFTEDTPTVIQVAATRGFPSFSHYASMLPFSPETVASGQLVNWDAILIDVVEKILDGTYAAGNLADVDYFWGLGEEAVEAGAEPGMLINPAYEAQLRAAVLDHPEFGEISVYDLVERRLEQMSVLPAEFEPFTGPLRDRKGNLVYAEGVSATLGELLGMEWAAENVRGPWDGEP
ncbi:MAG: BMP family ABC transporter substrate-binding protein [Trueperaceae bacterium]|nr:BMP family ABC transporter substrate-binding protein [Trueperaceae bacterium]